MHKTSLKSPKFSGGLARYARREQKHLDSFTLVATAIEQARVGAKRKNRERQVLRGEVHREADEKRQDGAPEPNAGELEGEEGGLREEGGRQKRVEHEGSGERDREGVHRGGLPDNYEVARKQPRRGFQADDDDERCKRREKPKETALRRQTRKGRSREGGTQGGKTADAPDD